MVTSIGAQHRAGWLGKILGREVDPSAVTPVEFEFLKEAMARRTDAKPTSYDDDVQDLWDWYRGVHTSLSDSLFSTYLPNLYKRDSALIRGENSRILKWLAEMMCVCTLRPPRVVLTEEDGSDVTNGHPSQMRLNQILREARAYRLWKQGEHLRWLCRMVGWHVVWRAGRLCLDLLLPNRLDVWESGLDPKHWPWARSIIVALDEPGTRLDDGKGMGNAERFAVYTLVGPENGDPRNRWLWGSYITDSGGKTYGNTLFADNVNHYGAHPVVLWHEEAEFDNIYPELDERWKKYQEMDTLKRTQLNHLEATAAFGRNIFQGPQLGLADIPASPDAILKFTGSVEENRVDTVPPTADIGAMRKAHNIWRKEVLMENHLPPQLADLETPSILTGAAIAEGRIPLTEAQISRAPAMADDVLACVQTLIRVNNYWARVDRRSADVIDESLTPRVEFWLPQLNAAVAQSQAQAEEIHFKTGRTASWKQNLLDRGTDWRTASEAVIRDARVDALDDAQFYLDTQKTKHERQGEAVERRVLREIREAAASATTPEEKAIQTALADTSPIVRSQGVRGMFEMGRDKVDRADDSEGANAEPQNQRQNAATREKDSVQRRR